MSTRLRVVLRRVQRDRGTRPIAANRPGSPGLRRCRDLPEDDEREGADLQSDSLSPDLALGSPA